MSTLNKQMKMAAELSRQGVSDGRHSWYIALSALADIDAVNTAQVAIDVGRSDFIDPTLSEIQPRPDIQELLSHFSSSEGIGQGKWVTINLFVFDDADFIAQKVNKEDIAAIREKLQIPSLKEVKDGSPPPTDSVIISGNPQSIAFSNSKGGIPFSATPDTVHHVLKQLLQERSLAHQAERKRVFGGKISSATDFFTSASTRVGSAIKGLRNKISGGVVVQPEPTEQ